MKLIQGDCTERDPDYFAIAKARIDNEILGEFEI